jgi:hypothetical protein
MCLEEKDFWKLESMPFQAFWSQCEQQHIDSNSHLLYFVFCLVCITIACRVCHSSYNRIRMKKWKDCASYGIAVFLLLLRQKIIGAIKSAYLTNLTQSQATHRGHSEVQDVFYILKFFAEIRFKIDGRRLLKAL